MRHSIALCLFCSSIALGAFAPAVLGAPAAAPTQAGKTPVAADGAHQHGAHEHHAGDGHDHSNNVREPEPSGRNETNTSYFWRKSDEAFHAGDYPRAIGLHKAIVALDPADVESYGVAAWLMWSMGSGDEAVAHIKRGLAANPN
ncbi:MAG TPA: tetratricopeptide repeat protein, partial [Abditibacteriaceae bacterium]